MRLIAVVLIGVDRIRRLEDQTRYSRDPAPPADLQVFIPGMVCPAMGTHDWMGGCQRFQPLASLTYQHINKWNPLRWIGLDKQVMTECPLWGWNHPSCSYLTIHHRLTDLGRGVSKGIFGGGDPGLLSRSVIVTTLQRTFLIPTSVVVGLPCRIATPGKGRFPRKRSEKYDLRPY
jgi:hypothetical protein